MNQHIQLHPYQEKTWYWPIDLTHYDRTPVLSETESTEINRQLWLTEQVRSRIKAVLHRLVQPIEDVLTFINAGDHARRDTIRFLIIEMHHRGTPFWAWSVEDWVEITCPNEPAFTLRYGRSIGNYHNSYARPTFPIVAYLLCSLPTIDPLLNLISIYPFARKIFGHEAIQEAVQQLTTVLESWGYQLKAMRNFTACICYLMLRNRSPYLEDLSTELLELIKQTCTIRCVRENIFRVSRVLYTLGIINNPVSIPRGNTSSLLMNSNGNISQEWFSWCQRWREYSTQQSIQSVYYPLLKVGRWLNVHHPEVTSPAQWTYELAAEYVATVNEMKIGEWTDGNYDYCLRPDRMGQPLSPNTKARMLKSMSVFLEDCQNWGWIPIRLDPKRALRMPRSLKSLIGPDPQIIDKEFWAKILWAAMNLQAEDVSIWRGDIFVYPLELVRAIAMVWCFTALRSDEIWRLRVGCIRWQSEDVMVPETGDTLLKDAVCFLDIPVNKTSTSYTKAVHPLVGKCINEWERVRPQQPLGVDRKTGEPVQFLFSYRGTHIAKQYINVTLIPILCKKAGIPEWDSRGKITSHRARATIASMLYNAKDPLSIFELKEYLGHKVLSSTQHYVQVDPTKLASRVAKAGYLEQNMATIEVLLDQEAVVSGAAARGEVWKYYDLGHGYCTNTFWAECKHRMACARCPFYRPKNSTIDQLVEGKANLVRMLEFIKLTEDEQLLVTEGIELHQALIDKLADVPTPAGPTPRELEASRQAETKVVPLEAIKRSNKKNRNKQE